MKARAYTLIVLVLLSITPALVGQPIQAQNSPATPGGLGVSGSFYTLDGLVVPAGGVVNTSEVYLVVYNYGEEDMTVRLGYSGPEFIHVEFLPSQENYTIPAGGHVRVQVVIRVDEDAIPGTYTVAVYAEKITRAEGGGVRVTASAGQDANITVTGEYAILTVRPLDPAGKVVENALVRIYGQVRGRPQALVDGYGIVTAKLIPGNYTVRVYLRGEEVANATVSLAPYENKTLDLPLRIVYIEFFNITPVTMEGRLAAVHVYTVIRNLYKTITDASIVLVVWKDGRLLEERPIARQTILPTGRSEYEFDYLPRGGWETGNYTFQLRVYGFQGKLLAESEKLWLYYEAPKPITLALLAVSIPIIMAVLALWWSRRRRRKRREEE